MTCSSFSWRIVPPNQYKTLKSSQKSIRFCCCKIQIVFKNQRKLQNVFRFKDHLPYDLVSCGAYKFQCGRCNASYCDKTDRHLKVKSREHICISPLIFKKVVESSIPDHLLFCNHDPLFHDFTISAKGTNKFFLEMKESILIKRDKPILNKKISSALLFLFDKVLYDWMISIIITCISFFCHGVFTLTNVHFFANLQYIRLLENACSCTRNVTEKFIKY